MMRILLGRREGRAGASTAHAVVVAHLLPVIYHTAKCCVSSYLGAVTANFLPSVAW